MNLVLGEGSVSVVLAVVPEWLEAVTSVRVYSNLSENAQVLLQWRSTAFEGHHE